jgi:hypothetical protein
LVLNERFFLIAFGLGDGRQLGPDIRGVNSQRRLPLASV